jgi:predicted Fe-Mo cluster-binding NifX family protein
MVTDANSGIVGKLAVAIEKPEESSTISEIFGRSKYFLIYEMKDDLEEIIPNPFTNELGRAGIQLVKFLIEKNVDAVIVNNIGLNPFRFLTSANIKVYHYKNGNAIDAIRLLKQNKLELLDSLNINYPLGRKRKRHGNKFFKNITNNKTGEV